MDLLSIITMGPPIFLLFMIYRADRVEKEPTGLLIKLFVLGMLSCLPAAFIESFLISALDVIMPDSTLLYIAIVNFLIVGMAEEGVKYVVLKTQTWKHKAFDYRFDGIVYAAVVSLGFAFFENMFYVFGDESAFFIAGMRAVTSIPGHCTFGIMMGYYYGQAKFAEKHGNMQECRQYLKMAYLIPLLLHGFYDFILSTDYEILFFVFIIYVIWLDLRAYRKVKDSAKFDTPVQEQNPYDQNPYGQNPNPYGQNPYGQNPYGQNQNPYGQNPYGQNQYRQNPNEQNQYNQNPYGQNPNGQYPNNQYQNGQYQNGQYQNGQNQDPRYRG